MQSSLRLIVSLVQLKLHLLTRGIGVRYRVLAITIKYIKINTYLFHNILILQRTGDICSLITHLKYLFVSITQNGRTYCCRTITKNYCSAKATTNNTPITFFNNKQSRNFKITTTNFTWHRCINFPTWHYRETWACRVYCYWSLRSVSLINFICI